MENLIKLLKCSRNDPGKKNLLYEINLIFLYQQNEGREGINCFLLKK